MNKKILRLIVSLCVMIFLFPVIRAAEKQFIVVIDAGHGGKDAGAVGASAKEKDINLAVALKFGKLINEKHKDVKVIYTRSTDKFVDLHERANIANRNNADLFISIHANAVKSNTVRGTETFTLGLERSAYNLEIAKKENSVILLEDNYLEKYEGFDPKSSESYIIFEFMQNKFMEQSIQLASDIESAFKTTARRSSRGVKQAAFIVLMRSTMPSVLVELGFLSNRDEENFLRSADGQNKLANSLLAAFTKYKNEYDRKQAAGGNTTTAVTQPAQTTSVPSGNTTANLNKGQLIYKIQILASESKLPANSRELKGYKDVDFYHENGLYKYTYGSTTDYEEIRALRRKIAKDFKDAFIIKFRDGKKVAN